MPTLTSSVGSERAARRAQLGITDDRVRAEADEAPPLDAVVVALLRAHQFPFTTTEAVPDA